MKYVNIFHANLNYAYLTPDRYEFVIRSAYEMMLDVMAERFADCKFVFEASGYTIDMIARYTPDVLAKLRRAIEDGRCEFMGSPYAHPMLANFPEADGSWAIAFANEAFERHLGLRPRSFWNPECGWRQYVPQQVLDNGYANLIGDFEAYSRSLGPDGKPLRPEIYEAEHSDEPAFYSFGFDYDLPGDEPAIHFPFDRVHGLDRGDLRMFLRTDRVAQFGVRFFMGMAGYTLERYLELIRRFSAQKAGEPEGALIIFADDAEYIGTNGWFRLKYQNQPDHVFEHNPDARQKLIDLMEAVRGMGEFVTFDQACRLPAMAQTLSFDDDSAWHGAQASTWAQTPMARLLRPWQDLVREALHERSFDEATRRQIWFHLTCSFNSDGQWPPTLPDAPHLIHPFNYRYCFEHLLRAELLIGGVDRSRIGIDPCQVVGDILGIQQRLVREKAQRLLAESDGQAAADAELARMLIERTSALDSMQGHTVLQPSEYAVRADALVEARRLVGGVEIEKVAAEAEQFMSE